jgi:DNA-binding transcriptional LysR family regulator
MSFEDLRAFLLVAEEGSFLSAADKLGVSRTTLRRQVDALEAQAGVPLLQRGAKGAVLTDAGKRLQAQGKAMDQEFTALLRAVRETTRRPEGEVRVLLPIGLPPQQMGVLFGMIRSSWPGLLLRTRFSEEPLSEKLSDVDVLIWFGAPDLGSTWLTQKLFGVPLRLLASHDYLTERGTPQSLEDLKGHDLLAWLPRDDRDAKLQTRAGASHTIHPALTSTNADFLHECARLGLGIAWVPDGGVPPPTGQEPLVRVLSDVVGTVTDLWLAVPRTMADVPKVRVFLENMIAMRDLVSTVQG